MKRQIKFRAWDDGVMYSIDNFYDENQYGEYDHLFFFFQQIRSDAVLMQFTGKVDKNGKEIYEGDLVRVEAGLSGATSGECSQMIGKVVYENIGFSGFTILLWAYQSWWAYGYLKSQTAEVIGNIYENPELLNKTD